MHTPRTLNFKQNILYTDKLLAIDPWMRMVSIWNGKKTSSLHKVTRFDFIQINEGRLKPDFGAGLTG